MKRQKPHRWNEKHDAELCIACSKPFRKGDLVYTDVAVNIHQHCLSKYEMQLIQEKRKSKNCS